MVGIECKAVGERVLFRHELGQQPQHPVQAAWKSARILPVVAKRQHQQLKNLSS